MRSGSWQTIAVTVLTAVGLTATVACGGNSGRTGDGAGGTDGGTPNDVDAAATCMVQAPTSCPDPAPRFADVQPIFHDRCVPCHYGMPGGPWPLTDYKHVADWYDIIRAAMLECSMPPADGGVPMTTEDRLAILTWIRCGYLP